MRKERPLRVISTLATVLFLPLLSIGQESRGQEEKKNQKKDELTQVETTEEHREGLDGKLDSSLSEFDALILKEQEILEKRREAEAAAGGGGGAGTAEAGSGEGGGGESEDAGENEDAGGKANGTGGSPDEPSGEEVTTEPNATEASPEAENTDVSNGRVPPDVGNGEDDDIVARQLREAAMKEEDPELREKLWEEYRAYKFGEKKKETGG